MKSRQTDMADRERRFGQNPIAEARANALKDAVCAALLDRYGNYPGVAEALSAAFGHVSEATVKACFADSERNYWRGDWIILVADYPDVRAAVAPPPVDPAAELARLREHLARRAPGELENFDRRVGRMP